MDGQTQESQLTFAEHIHELRRRLTWPALLLIVGGTVGYIFRSGIITSLRAPLNQTLYYNTPAGGFNFIMKVCFMLGLALAIPALVYNIISFIEPAVGKAITRRLIAFVTILSLTLGLAGAAFAYLWVLPMSLKFFGDIHINGISPLISADDYLNFALSCIITFIILFQIPLLVLFINHIKPMSPRKLLKYEKYVIVGSLALALVLPFTYDPITQFLIAVPIIVLYNLSVLMVWLANRRRRGKATQTAPQMVTMTPVAETIIEPQPILPPAPVVATAAVQEQQPTPIRRTFMDVTNSPVKRRPVVVRRPMLDVVTQPNANFLDLRSSK